MSDVDGGSPGAAWLAALTEAGRRRAKAGLTRRLRPRGPDDPVVDLAGNDYLGLSQHPDVLAAAQQALADYGLGATASRLVRGSTRPHAELERDLAGWLGAARALVYSSGYLANLGAIRALAQPSTLLVSDAHNHASLVDGCRLARVETVVAPHADAVAVRRLLAGRGDRPAVVVTESVFSVDGDAAPLPALHAACRDHGAVLLVDDAHGLGLLGPAGAGGVAAAGLAGEPDVVVTATLSKALGGAGGLVAGAEPLVTHLVETGRTFIYDTGLPPAVAAGVRAATAIARTADERRAELADRVRTIHRRLGLAGPVPVGGVVSVPAPGPEAALAWAQACHDLGVAVGCFRPPSTPDGGSRLRLTVNAGLPRALFERALSVVEAAAP